MSLRRLSSAKSLLSNLFICPCKILIVFAKFCFETICLFDKELQLINRNRFSSLGRWLLKYLSMEMLLLSNMSMGNGNMSVWKKILNNISLRRLSSGRSSFLDKSKWLCEYKLCSNLLIWLPVSQQLVCGIFVRNLFKSSVLVYGNSTLAIGKF